MTAPTRPVLRARAPLRISFAGGGTDVEPYTSEHGGCVLSATIDLFAYASVRTREDQVRSVVSMDGSAHTYRIPQDLVFDGDMDLVKACLLRLAPELGVDMELLSDAPAGSGLGSSSALVVAMLAAVHSITGRPVSPYELAFEAYRVERKDLRQAGGMQDQFAAAFGGFNFIEFHAEDRVVVNPLRIPTDTLNELHASMLLCYTGITRKSGGILREQIDHASSGDTRFISRLDRIKGLAVEMKDALLLGDLGSFAAGLNEGWEAKRGLASAISNPDIEKLHDVGMSAGAAAGKLLGAGGGGYFLFCCPPSKRNVVAGALEAEGSRVSRVSFVDSGVTTWRAGGSSVTGFS